ncbi:LysR family transcriptional regulator [Janthinobacterium sp. RB2R34]|uniref:LysR family transcriptional regulator n=1 Tax=Janthinobacterium sp. RB2R34 TaxID=3424193 RepID=UPI003F2562C7
MLTNIAPSTVLELNGFVLVARERSFRRASAILNVTPSALSHALRSLEQRIGVRLLHRTTRQVGLTEAGQVLYDQVEPALQAIGIALDSINAFRDHPCGQVRINVPYLAAEMVLARRFGEFTRTYPDIRLDMAINDHFVDIVKEGYDAGIRLGDSVAKEMVAVRVTPDLRTAIVASPVYWAAHPAPRTPKDLLRHRCISFRAGSSGSLYPWEFEKDGKTLTLQLGGPLVLDNNDMMIAAALDGVGVAPIVESTIENELREGSLVQVLSEWSPYFPGFFLYYPGRRQHSSALRAVVDFLRLASNTEEIR